MAEVLVLQHITCENPGTIRDALKRQGVASRYLHTDADPVPVALPEGISGLIVMGGPMGVYEADRYPFLTAEMKLIERAVRDEIPVLGVCLGAQLMAAALGGSVKPGPRKEIGWYRVDLDPAASADPSWSRLPPSFTGFHWHGDQIGLPGGAVRLAKSEITPNQAFRYGRSAYGIQFHLEVDRHLVESMSETFADELAAERIDAAQILAGRETHLSALEAIGRTLFDDWTRLVVERAGK